MIRVYKDPFKVTVKSNVNDSIDLFSLEAMIYEDYLNWIKVKAYTESGDNFRGVFGLGERANMDFFYKTGVYSMWSKDIPTPIETGDLPASNMYGTHPYFMYKHRNSSWVGVLYKLAQAQDWWIKNNQSTGEVGI